MASYGLSPIRKTTLSPEAIAVGQRIKGLRDFLALLDENGQLVLWEDEVLPEPDIRNISFAAGRDARQPSCHGDVCGDAGELR